VGFGGFLGDGKFFWLPGEGFRKEHGAGWGRVVLKPVFLGVGRELGIEEIF
jgi:hypothetical protein